MGMRFVCQSLSIDLDSSCRATVTVRNDIYMSLQRRFDSSGSNAGDCEGFVENSLLCDRVRGDDCPSYSDFLDCWDCVKLELESVCDRFSDGERF